MKKCIKCQNKWNVIPDLSIKTCPSCTGLHEALKALFTDKNQTAFCETSTCKDTLLGYVNDLAPNAEKKHKNILRIFVNNNLHIKLLQAKDDLEIQRLKSSFCNNYGFNNSFIDYVFNCFLYAFGRIDNFNQANNEQSIFPKPTLSTTAQNLEKFKKMVTFAGMDNVIDDNEKEKLFKQANILKIAEQQAINIIKQIAQQNGWQIKTKLILKEEALQEFNTMINFVGTEGVIGLSDNRNLMKKAGDLGIKEVEAKQVIKEIAQKNQWKLVNPP